MSTALVPTKKADRSGKSTALPDEVDVAIVGGGVMGLGLAYELALRQKSAAAGRKPLRIAVLEASHLVAGASGRNGGGLRMQWGDPDNVRVMMRSIEICRRLAQRLRINLWFRQGGYLFLARSERSERLLVRNLDVHREVGAPTRLLDPTQVQRLNPYINTRDVRLASYNPQDGVVFPWAFVWGYAAKAAELGVLIKTHQPVDALESGPGDRMTLRLAGGRKLVAQRVVNATGAWAGKLNRSVGLHFPTKAHRHEILSTEPLKPFLDPLIVDFDTGLYASQSTRGELVTGITVADPPGVHRDGLDNGSSLRFLAEIGRTLTDILPITRSLHPLRQWAGPYDASADGDAIVGPSPGLDNLIQICGFTGHGFMMAPAVAEMLAAYLHDGTSHPMLTRWDPKRFVEGRQRQGEDMIIG